MTIFEVATTSHNLAIVILAIAMARFIFRERFWTTWRLRELLAAVVAFLIVDLIRTIHSDTMLSPEIAANRLIATLWLALCLHLGRSTRGGTWQVRVSAAAASRCMAPNTSRDDLLPVLKNAVPLGLSVAVAMIAWSIAVIMGAQSLALLGEIRTVFEGWTVIFHVADAAREEIVYRLGIQSFLVLSMRSARHPQVLAVVATSVLFSFGHTAGFETPLVKYLQIFPVSCVLGILYLRSGVASCILAHAVLNIALAWMWS